VIRPEVLAIFVRFVRLNPQVAAGDPLLVRVLEAYDRTVPALELEAAS
jgi:hypothetical protein